MRIKKALHINIGIAAALSVIIVVMLFAGLHRIKIAFNDLEMSNDILSILYERNALRVDYLRTDSQRAQIQWFAVNEEIGGFLDTARIRFEDSDTGKIIDSMLENQGASLQLFSGIVDIRDKARSGRVDAVLAREIENMLISQLNIRTYENVLNIKELRESVELKLFGILETTGVIVAFTIIIPALLATINILGISRTITRRIDKLRKGAAIIGAGNLDYRISGKDDDEFSELSRDFNHMAAKLENSYRDLERSRALLSEAESLSNSGAWEWDPIKGTMTFSEQWKKIHGVTKCPLTAEESLAIVHPGDRKAIEQALTDVRKGNNHFEMEHRIIRQDNGDIRVIMSKGEFVRDSSGAVVRIYGFGQDITERKYAEKERERLISELEAANRELEGFTHSVSHDIRAPIRHLSMFSHLLLKKYGTSMDDKASRYVNHIADAAANLSTLVDELLELSRIGRMALQKQKVDVSRIVDKIVAIYKDQHRERHIEWKINPLPEIMGDPAMLQLVFTNLIDNAVKYTGKRAKAMIEIGSEDKKENYLFYVKDNGAGFDMKYYDKLFNIFQRLHTPDEFPGTGLGLANVQRIIQRHAGRIWATSEIGKGAVFFISFPKP
ncbi:MAG: ATP-binding protein [Desulfobulbaceae bacterium]|nr:ATP-binding protein [Desulfobulbaceae bacterium]